jgi:NAD(P)-dependent dehydrogenase (short-subunit alcohol dehydrogenase family)
MTKEAEQARTGNLRRGGMEIDSAGKRVVVTGASRGIGREIAHQFSESGARVAIDYVRNREAAEQTRAEMAGNGHLLLQRDASDAAAIQPMTRTAIRKMERIDVGVCSGSTQ